MVVAPTVVLCREAIPTVHVLAIAQRRVITVMAMIAIIVRQIVRQQMAVRRFIIHVVMAVRYRAVQHIAIAITRVRIALQELMVVMVQHGGIVTIALVRREV
jgi:hypothetical protein